MLEISVAFNEGIITLQQWRYGKKNTKSFNFLPGYLPVTLVLTLTMIFKDIILQIRPVYLVGCDPFWNEEMKRIENVTLKHSSTIFVKFNVVDMISVKCCYYYNTFVSEKL